MKYIADQCPKCGSRNLHIKGAAGRYKYHCETCNWKSDELGPGEVRFHGLRCVS